MDRQDFIDEFAEALNASDFEFVEFDNEKGLFMTQEKVRKFLERMGDFSEKALNEEKRAVIIDGKKRIMALEDQIKSVNLLLSKATKQEKTLMNDIVELEEALAKSKKELDAYNSQYGNEKKRYLDLIKRYKIQIEDLQRKKDPEGFKAEIEDLRAKGKEAQHQLDLLKKEKGEKVSEQVVLKMRVASYKALLEEEGAHFIAIRNQFEDALRAQKSFGEYISDYSEKAAQALGITNVLERIFGMPEDAKACAWDLIELARKSDPRNKLGSRDLATRAYQHVKARPYKQRKTLLALIQSTATAISLGSKDDIQEVKTKWDNLENKSAAKKEEEELTAEDLFEEIDIDIPADPLKKSWTARLKEKFQALRKLDLNPFSKLMKVFKSPFTAIRRLWTRDDGVPTKIHILWGNYKSGHVYSWRKSWNDNILLQTRYGKNIANVPYLREHFDKEVILAECCGFSVETVRKWKLVRVENKYPYTAQEEAYFRALREASEAGTGFEVDLRAKIPQDILNNVLKQWEDSDD